MRDIINNNMDMVQVLVLLMGVIKTTEVVEEDIAIVVVAEV
jgi:hypothetical protein